MKPYNLLKLGAIGLINALIFWFIPPLYSLPYSLQLVGFLPEFSLLEDWIIICIIIITTAIVFRYTVFALAKSALNSSKQSVRSVFSMIPFTFWIAVYGILSIFESKKDIISLVVIIVLGISWITNLVLIERDFAEKNSKLASKTPLYIWVSSLFLGFIAAKESSDLMISLTLTYAGFAMSKSSVIATRTLRSIEKGPKFLYAIIPFAVWVATSAILVITEILSDYYNFCIMYNSFVGLYYIGFAVINGLSLIIIALIAYSKCKSHKKQIHDKK